MLRTTQCNDHNVTQDDLEHHNAAGNSQPSRVMNNPTQVSVERWGSSPSAMPKSYSKPLIVHVEWTDRHQPLVKCRAVHTILLDHVHSWLQRA
jgi:hypothetical protein